MYSNYIRENDVNIICIQCVPQGIDKCIIFHSILFSFPFFFFNIKLTFALQLKYLKDIKKH